MINPDRPTIVNTVATLPDLTEAEEREYPCLVAEAKSATKDRADAQGELWIEKQMEKEAITGTEYLKLHQGSDPDGRRRAKAAAAPVSPTSGRAGAIAN